MPALNFQARFAPLVESGEKRQTIRAKRKDGRDPKPGDPLYLYTGMRTKECRKLGDAKCESTSSVLIEIDGWVITVLVDGRWLPLREVHELAKADGFADASEMVVWFEKTHGLPFEGLLIRWDDVDPASRRGRG